MFQARPLGRRQSWGAGRAEPGAKPRRGRAPAFSVPPLFPHDSQRTEKPPQRRGGEPGAAPARINPALFDSLNTVTS